jgi:TrbL/VirB6 plasmid conjugal transfer protein
MRKLSIAGLVVTPALYAQSGPLPVNSGSVDYITMVTSSVDHLVTSGSPLFLSTGSQLLSAIGVIMLIVYGLKWAAFSASRHHPEFDFPGLIHFFGLFLIAEAMLRYYNVPLPWGGSSFHQILPDTARQLSGIIDISSLNTVLGRMSAIITGTERPSVMNPLMLFVYACVMFDMALIEGILFAVTVLGFIAVGIGSLLGPLFIPWLIVPRLNWLFWNWIQFMLQYSFYRVVASALVYIWTNVIVGFLDSSVHGDYSLPHFLLLIVPFGMLNVALFFSVFKVTSFVSDLFKGTAAAGSGMASSLAGVIRGAFA